MAGGLMNLISEGNENIILNQNPKKSFFKATYRKYTNFGLQKFRVDFDGSRTLRLNEESTVTFKIPRYGDLLMDTCLQVTLPHIWSPILPPTPLSSSSSEEGRFTNGNQWAPYEFKWIEYIGAQMISKISITCGNATIQEFSGAYLLAMVQRDFTEDKKQLFYKMIGHVPELYDPGNAGSRVNSYPTAFYSSSQGGAEPSIRSRTLYIPLNTWFSLKSQMAFPLVALQNNELHITITFRPIQELCQIRDVYDPENHFPYIAPNFNQYYMQFYRFLQTPPDIPLTVSSYSDTRTLWNPDIHLRCTYGFLSDMEQYTFAKYPKSYLFKQIREKQFHNVTGSRKLELDSLGLITNWMFYFQRSDVNLRNEWSNYTNWPYRYLPNDLQIAPTNSTYQYEISPGNFITIGPGVNPNGQLTGWFITGDFNFENTKDILINLGILLDGIYRENVQPLGVFDLMEKYHHTLGNAPDGLYTYQFCLQTGPTDLDLQPNGAMNMNRFKNIELEINTIIPSLNPLAQSLNVCDPITGKIIGVNKPTWRIYDYNFNMTLFEERINQLHFIGGNCGLQYAT